MAIVLPVPGMVKVGNELGSDIFTALPIKKPNNVCLSSVEMVMLFPFDLSVSFTADNSNFTSASLVLPRFD